MPKRFMVQLAYCKIWLHLIGQVLVLVTSDWSVLVLVKQPEKCLTVAQSCCRICGTVAQQSRGTEKGMETENTGIWRGIHGKIINIRRVNIFNPQKTVRHCLSCLYGRTATDCYAWKKGRVSVYSFRVSFSRWFRKSHSFFSIRSGFCVKSILKSIFWQKRLFYLVTKFLFWKLQKFS